MHVSFWRVEHGYAERNRTSVHIQKGKHTMRKLLFAVVLLVPTFAFGQGLGLELTPSVGYRWGGEITAGQTDLFPNDVAIADGGSFGLTFDVPLTRSMQLELMADHQSTNFEDNGELFGGDQNLGDVDMNYYHAGLLFEFPGRDVRPFMVVGLGIANIDPQIAGTSAESRFSGSIGGGVKVFMTDNVGLRLEARGFWTDTDDRERDCHFDYDCYYSYNNDLAQGQVKMGVIFAF